MLIQIPAYSSDVFFYPWVGKKYKNGINFTPDGKVIYFDENKWYYYNENKEPQEAPKIAPNTSPLRLAVLGKEHYCSPKENQKQIRERNQDQQTYINLLSQLLNQPRYVQKQINFLLSQAQKYNTCHMHLKSGEHCAHLTICHHKTNEVIEDFLRNPNAKYYKSFQNFGKALLFPSNKNFSQICNHFLFCEFYQRGMPKEKNNSHNERDKHIALKAFAEVIKQHQPNIIITWGKEDKLPILDLQNEEIKLRQMPRNKKPNFIIPRLHVSFVGTTEKNTKYTIPFTVLDYNNTSCLVLMPTHPGTSYDSCKINTIIRCAFKYYDKLIQWNPKLNEKNLGTPITCQFNSYVMCKLHPEHSNKTDFKWNNESDFDKCIFSSAPAR